MSNPTDKEIENLLEELSDSHVYIKFAVFLCKRIPKDTKEYKTLRKAILNVKSSLIELDVLVEDLQWNYTENMLRKQGFYND